jgi:MFS family permease
VNLAAEQPPLPAALAEPRTRARRRFVAALSLANAGMWMAFFTPIQVLLPQQVEAIDRAGKVTALGWVTGAGALVAIVANPLAGALSDRTCARWGRRTPWVLGGAVAGALALALLATARSVLGVLLGWCLAQACINTTFAAATATVPDQVPVDQRGAVSGWVGLAQSVGLVGGVVLVTVLVTGNAGGYLAVAAVLALGVVPLVLVLRGSQRDLRLPRELRPPWRAATFARELWVSPRAHPDFGWAWITRFLVSLGNALGTLYLLYFLRDAVHYERVFPGRRSEDGVLVLVAVYTVALLATVVVGGVVSDRTGRRKVFVVGATVVMAAGAAVLVVRQTWPAALVAAAVLGAGYGVYLAVDQALITQVLPAAAARGKDLGVINIANSAPQVLAPALAAPVIAHVGGYPSLYALTAVVTLLGAVLVLPIRSVP